MTTEPRQEAERIVRGVLSWDWPSGSQWDRHYELVVDALAAAIRVDRDDAFAEDLQGLSEALSALREDETWHAS